MTLQPIPESRAEWLKLRKNYVGASESAALLNIPGLQAEFQTSAFALWHAKAGLIELPDISNERTESGNLFEDAIAVRVGQMQGWTILPGVFAIDDTTEGMSATLDRVIEGPTGEDRELGFTGPGALEIKNVASDQAYKWDDGEPPPHILIQLQHQLACSDFAWGAVGACFGGNRFFVRRYARHEGIISGLRKSIAAFWQSIRDNKPPPPDRYDSTTTALRSLYPSPSKPLIDLTMDNELPELCAKAIALASERKRVIEEESEVRNRIRAKIASGRRATVAGGFRISRSVGEDIPDRPAKPGEIIPGRKGLDRLTITQAKEA